MVGSDFETPNARLLEAHIIIRQALGDRSMAVCGPGLVANEFRASDIVVQGKDANRLGITTSSFGNLKEGQSGEGVWHGM